jgi:hypothetical protein
LGGGGGGGYNSGAFITNTFGGSGINNGGNGTYANGAAGSGGANTGGGGGGLWIGTAGSGAGGSGIVVIAFPQTAVLSNQSAVLPSNLLTNYNAVLNNASLTTGAYNSTKGAFACKLLNYNYFGPIMTLRHSLDTTGTYTVNFYADVCGNLGTGYLGTGLSVYNWLSGNGANTNYAYVTKWYNQGMDVSFNSATQYTLGSQPVYEVAMGVINYGYTTGYTTGTNLPSWGATGNAFLNLPNGAYPTGDTSFSITNRFGNFVSSNNYFWGGGVNTGTATQNALYYGSTSYNSTWSGSDFGTSTLSIIPNTTVTVKYTTGALGLRYIYVNNTAYSGSGNGAARNQSPLQNYIASTYNNAAYGNNQLYNMYIFQSSLIDADRTLIEATPYTYTLSNIGTITGLLASPVTMTNFVLSWTAVSGAQSYVLFVNGSAYGTVTNGGTVTPSTIGGTWTLNLYAYNATGGLLATGMTGVTMFCFANTTTNSGATKTTNGANTVFTYTSSGTFTVDMGGYASVLIVGGGGAGGAQAAAGGGGAGGLVYFDAIYKPMYLNAGSYTVTVGTGGNNTTTGNGANGLDSVFNSYIAKGGGGGGAGGASANNGGCGGGGGYIAGSGPGGTGGTTTQISYASAYYVGGYAGGLGGGNYVGAGGGGAGGVGQPGVTGNTAGNGGVGYQCNITGSNSFYGGGGGGSQYAGSNQGIGGSGIGG